MDFFTSRAALGLWKVPVKEEALSPSKLGMLRALSTFAGSDFCPLKGGDCAGTWTPLAPDSSLRLFRKHVMNSP